MKAFTKHLNPIHIILLACSLSLLSCESDTTEPPPVENVLVVELKKGASYQYTYDSLLYGGESIRLTDVAIRDFVLDTISFQGMFGYMIVDSTIRNLTNVKLDTIYLSYDSAAGKLYQFGVRKFFNDSQASSYWDLIADFSLPTGQEWLIASVGYFKYLGPPLDTTVFFFGEFRGKVAADTTINTTGSPPRPVKCFHLVLKEELRAYFYNPGLDTLYTTKILEEFISYNQSGDIFYISSAGGIVRIRLGGSAISDSPDSITYFEPGFDRVLQSYTP